MSRRSFQSHAMCPSLFLNLPEFQIKTPACHAQKSPLKKKSYVLIYTSWGWVSEYEGFITETNTVYWV